MLVHHTTHRPFVQQNPLRIWFKDWLKEHIEWYFEPDTVPENLKKQYQANWCTRAERGLEMKIRCEGNIRCWGVKAKRPKVNARAK